MELSQSDPREYHGFSGESEVDPGESDTSDTLAHVGPRVTDPSRHRAGWSHSTGPPVAPRRRSGGTRSRYGEKYQLNESRKNSDMIEHRVSPTRPFTTSPAWLFNALPIDLTSAQTPAFETGDNLAQPTSPSTNLQSEGTVASLESRYSDSPPNPHDPLFGSPSTLFEPPPALDHDLEDPSNPNPWDMFPDSIPLSGSNYTPDEGYVDLTEDTPPPQMLRPISTRTTRARAARSDRTPSVTGATDGSNSEEAASRNSEARPSKRRRVQREHSPILKDEVEEVDLVDVDDDTRLSNALQEQAIKSQQSATDKPARLSHLQCVICLEKLTNMTLTKCGKFDSTRSGLPALKLTIFL